MRYVWPVLLPYNAFADGGIALQCDKAQCELIERTKAIEWVFNKTDKAFLVAQDRLRAEQHELLLTIHKAGQLLAQRSADSVRNNISNSEMSLSTNGVDASLDDNDHLYT